MSHEHHHEEPQDPQQFWEERYRGQDQVWSGRVNAVLASVAEALPPGTALDLGCGEGGDVVWLAEQGWEALGIDISEAAVHRGEVAAQVRGVADRARFEAQDLSSLKVDASFDLVTASFLQSPVALERESILRTAASLVAPGGRLLLTSHAAPPPWAGAAHGQDFKRIRPEQELEALALDEGEWTVEVAEIRLRDVKDPDGNPAQLEDCVVLAHRRPARQA